MKHKHLAFGDPWWPLSIITINYYDTLSDSTMASNAANMSEREVGLMLAIMEDAASQGFKVCIITCGEA